MEQEKLIIKKSNRPNAGNGVFVTKKYNKGEYICFYDGIKKNKIESINDFIYSTTDPNDTNIKMIGHYDVIHNILGIGQFINDYSMFELDDNFRCTETQLFSLFNKAIDNAIAIYTKESSENSNVGMNENFEIYAKRDIKEGEELYISYEIHYWISKIILESDEPLTKLFCLVKNNIVNLVDDVLSYSNDDANPIKIFDRIRMLPNGSIINHLGLQNYSDDEKLIELIKLLS